MRDYDLHATLDSGQAFRWRRTASGWEGIIRRRWVSLKAGPELLMAEAVAPVEDWSWLVGYLQLEVNLDEVLGTFPADEPMRAAIRTCHGLRLLRQEPWECLASFLLSSTKQIVQIRQMVGLLCERFGDPVPAAAGSGTAWTFPSAARLAASSEQELRACKLGFRAKYLRGTAQWVAEGRLNLERVAQLPLEAARAELEQLPGVGRKIADCVLLFAYGFPGAFPVDVWVARALRRMYFPRRKVTLRRLHEFSATHFGPHGGFAQQYLFHYMRRRTP